MENESKRREGRVGASSEAARNRMRAAKPKDTAPELALRKELDTLGLIYRVDTAVLTGVRRKADIVFDEARIVIFVDGCFWHGCPLHGTWPKKNEAFWREKIETNQRRDEDTNRRLQEAGWLVIRAWEHEDAKDLAVRILDLLKAADGQSNDDSEFIQT